jgi:hypothetical protein
MAGAISIMGPDGPRPSFPIVQIDGMPPFLSEVIEIQIANVGDTALINVSIFDLHETGHLELSSTGRLWTDDLSLPSPLMPGESKSILARASFSETDGEGVSEIQIAAEAQSVPVEVVNMVRQQSLK